MSQLKTVVRYEAVTGSDSWGVCPKVWSGDALCAPGWSCDCNEPARIQVYSEFIDPNVFTSAQTGIDSTTSKVMLTVSSSHMSLQMPSLLRPPKTSILPSGKAVRLWHMRSHGQGTIGAGSATPAAAAAAGAEGGCGSCSHLQQCNSQQQQQHRSRICCTVNFAVTWLRSKPSIFPSRGQTWLMGFS
jgi:hypothetical protein